VFGVPAAQAIPAQMERLGTRRAFLVVSGTLNRTTDEIRKIRESLGERCVAVFDAMAAHSPRQGGGAPAGMARAATPRVIVTIGGGSITDGAKSVQLCLANDVGTADDMKRIRITRGVAPPMNAPTVRQISVPTTVSGGEFSDISGITNEKSKIKE